jgi:thiol-disulfide isomerase/thioredoxin
MKRKLAAHFIVLLNFLMTCCIAQEQDRTYLNCLAKFPLQQTNMPESFQRLHDCAVGSTLPPFEFTSSDGINYRSENFKGKVTLISMWFTACAPCVVEIPYLNQLHDSLDSKNFQMYSFTPDTDDIVALFRSKQKISFPVVTNAKVLLEKSFMITSLGYPTIIVLDKNSRILEFTVGGPVDDMQAAQASSHLRKIISDYLAD